MSLTQLISKPCTLIRRTESGDEDDFENVGPDETYVFTVCEIQQSGSAGGVAGRKEPANQGDLSVTTWDVWFPLGTTVRSGDALLVDDLGEFEFIGAPWHARNPRTDAEWFVEATAKQTRGPEEGGS